MNKIKLLISVVILSIMAVMTVSCDEKPTEIAVEGISISPETDSLMVGDTLVFTVTVMPETATNKEFTLFSSNPELVEIDGASIVALKKGTVTITATSKDGAKMDTAEIVISEEENEEPQPPVEPLTFNIEFRESTPTDFVIRVLPSNETSRYWIWCAAAEDFDGMSSDDIIAQDRELIDMMIEAYSEEEGIDVTIEQLLGMYTYVGAQDCSISNIIYPFAELQPATDYLVYVYGMELDGTATTEVYTFTQTTPSIYGSDDQYGCILAFDNGKYKDYKGDGSNWSVILTAGADELTMDLYPAVNGQLEGKYSSDDSTANPLFSYFGYNSPEYGNGIFAFLEMEVEITKVGDEYTILCTGKLETNVTVKLTYEGPLTFVENSNPNPNPAPDPDPDPTPGDVVLHEITFTSADYWTSLGTCFLNLYGEGMDMAMIAFVPANETDWSGSYSVLDDTIKPLSSYFYCTGLEGFISDDFVMEISKSGDSYTITGSVTMEECNPVHRIEFTFTGPVPEGE